MFFGTNHQPYSRTAFRLTTLLLLAALLLSACGFGPDASPTPDLIQIGTAAAGTIEAGGAPATIQAQSALLTSQVAELQSTQQALGATQTALVPAGSPTAATPAGAPGAQTPAPGTGGAPTVSVSADTNCRQGPGTGYPIVGMLRVGQSTAVQGKDATGSWYYVTNPGGSGACWLWNQFATVQGSTAALQVVNAPAPPAAPAATATGQTTPGATAATTGTATATTQAGVSAATVAFSNLHRCGGVVAAVLVQNTGEVAFRSARVTVRDPASGKVLGQFSSDTAFLTGENDCPPGRNNLAPGESAYVIGSVDEVLAAGSAGRATVALCTEKGQGGECEEFRLDFTFPDI